MDTEIQLLKKSIGEIEMDDVGVRPPETIDLSQIDMPVRMDDRSFDRKMLPDLIRHLQDIRDHSVDYVAPGEKMTFQPTNDAHEWELEIATEEGIKIFHPTNWAQKQSVDRTPIPRRYHDDMLRAGKSPLATTNLNSWYRDKEGMMVRTVGDRFRAMVSPSFFAYDSLDMLKQVAVSIKTINDSRLTTEQPVQFYKADCSETHIYLDLIDEGQQYDIGKGDMYSAMLIVQNNEVGAGSMSIEPGFFRWACINRAIKSPVLRKIHRGEKLDEGIFSPETRKLAAELWHRQVRDVMNSTLVNHNLFEVWAQELRESKEIKVVPTVSVKKVAEEFKITDDEVQLILDCMMSDKTVEPDDRDSAYAIIQGMTAAAKQMPPDRSYEFGKMAGETRQILTVLAA